MHKTDSYLRLSDLILFSFHLVFLFYVPPFLLVLYYFDFPWIFAPSWFSCTRCVSLGVPKLRIEIKLGCRKILSGNQDAIRLKLSNPCNPVNVKLRSFFISFFTYFTIPTLSKTSLKVRHTLSNEPYGRKIPRVQRDLRYDNFGSYLILKTESNNFLLIVVIMKFESLDKP